jgi:hypothetical protein
VSLTRPDGDVRSHNILGTTPEFLENALTMTMETELVGDALEVEIAIENDRTGHRVPTGVTIRNMILLVEAWEVEDGIPLEYTGTEVIHDLGGCVPESPPDECVADPDDGYYGGLPGRLYAKLNQDALLNAPTFFTDAVSIVFDNRIPALETDATEYSFRVPPHSGQVHVRARVIYRRSWRALVDAKQWEYDGHGEPLEDIAPPHFGHLMASAEATLGEPPMPMPDAGVPDAGGPDGGTGGDSGGGCSASGAPRSPASGLVLLCLLAIWTLRRTVRWTS